MESLAGLPLATFWRRWAAFWIDLALLLVAYIPCVGLIEWFIKRHEKGVHIDLRFDFHEPSNIVFMLLYFGLTLWWGNGQTPGKRLLGIRVVSLVHEPDHLLAGH